MKNNPNRIIVPASDGRIFVAHAAINIPLETVLASIANEMGEPVTNHYILHYKSLPDYTFKKAWEHDPKPPFIKINLDKAKAFAHTRRQKARDIEMKPFDDIVAKQIPGNSGKDAEDQRVILRKKYDDLQVAIDAATTVEELKTTLTPTLDILQNAGKRK